MNSKNVKNPDGLR